LARDAWRPSPDGGVEIALFYVALIILAFDILVGLLYADSRPIDQDRATRWFPGHPRD